MKTMPMLFIITGPAATGKTTLGRRLSQEFNLPFFHKDGFKEMMYDVVERQSGAAAISIEMSCLLGQMSIECLRMVMEEILSKGVSLIIEANFDAVLFSPCVRELQQRCPFNIVQMQLKCEGNTLLNRFVQRERENRHPGHQGLKQMARVSASLLRGEEEPLDVGGDLLVFDTTDFDLVRYDGLFDLARKRLLERRDVQG